MCKMRNNIPCTTFVVRDHVEIKKPDVSQFVCRPIVDLLPREIQVCPWVAGDHAWDLNSCAVIPLSNLFSKLTLHCQQMAFTGSSKFDLRQSFKHVDSGKSKLGSVSKCLSEDIRDQQSAANETFCVCFDFPAVICVGLNNCKFNFFKNFVHSGLEHD